jgi:CHAT domain-containing protein
LLRQGGDDRPAPAGFLAFGSPSAGVAGSGTRGGAALRSAGDAKTIAELPGLPGSAAELAALARAVGARDPRIFTGAAATEAAFRAQPLPPGGIVAFATHGLVSGELEGLREPALVLTPAGEDDGLLTASEIARLSLPASWAILSACDTAAGAGPDAPGLTGLAQAFLFAGTRHLLATHWPVRDDVATRLTVGTLSRASAGVAPAEALRQAVLALRRDRSLKGAGSPSVWGPFVLIE